VRTTWAPRGQTPILHHHWRRGETVSIAAFIRQRAMIFF
jgi:hypothetical protein